MLALPRRMSVCSKERQNPQAACAGLKQSDYSAYSCSAAAYSLSTTELA